MHGIVFVTNQVLTADLDKTPPPDWTVFRHTFFGCLKTKNTLKTGVEIQHQRIKNDYQDKTPTQIPKSNKFTFETCILTPIVGRYVCSTVHVPSNTSRTWKWSPTPERYMFLRTPKGPGSGPSPPITRHRFGHQSGLDARSSRNSATFRLRIAFPVDLVFPKINIITESDKKSWL